MLRPLALAGCFAVGGCALVAGLEEGTLDPNFGQGGGATVAGTGAAGTGGAGTGGGTTTATTSSGGGATTSTSSTGGAGGSGAAGSAYAAAVLQDTPVAYWRLGEDVTPTAFDAVGDADGTYMEVQVGAEGAVGDGDTAAYFDGNGSNSIAIAPGYAFSGQAQHAIEFWAKPETVDLWFIGEAFNGTPDRGWFFFGNDTQFGIKRDEAYVIVPQLTQNAWSHVVASYDGVTMTMYVNGVQAGSSVMDFASAAHSEPLTFGRVGWWTPFIGTLDEVAIYDHQLSAARVKAHYDIATGN